MQVFTFVSTQHKRRVWVPTNPNSAIAPRSRRGEAMTDTRTGYSLRIEGQRITGSIQLPLHSLGAHVAPRDNLFSFNATLTQHGRNTP